ncbi:MAG: hypothetical protein JO323_09515 [Acidobacteriia bacterium]|nr:hypothetical protein [Terriglobia bacterium]
MAFLESRPQNLPLPGGGTLFLHTLGTNSATSVGWVQIQASLSVVAYAIFTQRVPGRTDQDGTAPAAAGAAHILVPFDNSSGFVTSVALVNPTGASENVAVNIETEAGVLPPIFHSRTCTPSGTGTHSFRASAAIPYNGRPSRPRRVLRD